MLHFTTSRKTQGALNDGFLGPFVGELCAEVGDGMKG